MVREKGVPEVRAGHRIQNDHSFWGAGCLIDL